MKTADISDIKITVIYDNTAYSEQCVSDWGFSCLIEGLDRTILFDTGTGEIPFTVNIRALGVDLAAVDTIVLSHEHFDHVGNLMTCLRINPKVDVVMPRSFSSGIKQIVRDAGAKVIEIDDSAVIAENCISSGDMKSPVINEQAVYILTNRGPIVVTGCAHPGIVEIVHRAVSFLGKDLLLVMGGFHLMNDDRAGIGIIIQKFRDVGVRYVAPTHCTGEPAKRLFAEAYGKNYLECGAGRIFTQKDLA